MKHNQKLPHILQDALLILFAALMLLAFFCYAWASCDRLSWVRLVIRTVPQGALRAFLLGWF